MWIKDLKCGSIQPLWYYHLSNLGGAQGSPGISPEKLSVDYVVLEKICAECMQGMFLIPWILSLASQKYFKNNYRHGNKVLKLKVNWSPSKQCSWLSICLESSWPGFHAQHFMWSPSTARNNSRVQSQENFWESLDVAPKQFPQK